MHSDSASTRLRHKGRPLVERATKWNLNVILTQCPKLPKLNFLERWSVLRRHSRFILESLRHGGVAPVGSCGRPTWLPHAAQSGRVWRANNSILGNSGYIRSISS